MATPTTEQLSGLVALADPSGPGLPFAKGEGTGNDFVLLPDRDDRLRLTPELVRRLCDRRFGIGGDGCMRVAPGDDSTWFMDYVNADGSLAEMCGNGARVYARYLVALGWAAPGRIVLRTRGGDRIVHVPGDPAADIAVDMGPPLIHPDALTAVLDGERFTGTKLSMGNPHLACPVDNPARLDLTSAPTFSAADFPEGVNVEFYSPRDSALVMRVYERGSAETLSCGTGACAVAVADAVSRGVSSTDVFVDVPGGRLRVVWEGASVTLHGPAHIVAAGRWWE
jgi:diaminopimelate epimerase